MSRLTRALLGVLAVFPICYMLVFVVTMVGIVLSMSPRPQPGGLFPFFWLLPLHMLAMLVTIVQIAVFVVHLFRNDRLQGDMRIMWLIVLLMVGTFAAPVYWYLQIWKIPEEANTPIAPSA